MVTDEIINAGRTRFFLFSICLNVLMCLLFYLVHQQSMLFFIFFLAASLQHFSPLNMCGSKLCSLESLQALLVIIGSKVIILRECIRNTGPPEQSSIHHLQMTLHRSSAVLVVALLHFQLTSSLTVAFPFLHLLNLQRLLCFFTASLQFFAITWHKICSRIYYCQQIVLLFCTCPWFH